MVTSVSIHGLDPNHRCQSSFVSVLAVSNNSWQVEPKVSGLLRTPGKSKLCHASLEENSRDCCSHFRTVLVVGDLGTNLLVSEIIVSSTVRGQNVEG